MDTPIPKEDLDRAYRKLSRRVAALVLEVMAEHDVSFAELALRLEWSESKLRRWFSRLADGSGQDLRPFSDMAFALGTELTLSLKVFTAPAPAPADIADDVADEQDMVA